MPNPGTGLPGQRLRDLLDAGAVMAPGAFNGLCAMAVRDAGFQAAYVSGGATSVCAGVPDVGLLTLDHFTRVVREVCDASGLPVIADADTGFGEEEMLRRTVIEYARAGAAALHLEDQVFPKRCGHLDGKTLIDRDRACERIRWARQASLDVSEGTFVICARTDARGVEGMEGAIERARAYVEAGAEMLFPEGLKTEEEFVTFAEANRGTYLLANMTEFGKTPLIPFERFQEIGYHVVIYPVTMTRVAMGAVTRALATLREEGTVESILDEMQDREALYGMVGYTPGSPWSFPTGRPS